MHEPVGREDSSAAQAWAEDAKFGSLREVIVGPAADAGFGDARRRRSGTTGRCEIRGNPEIHRRHGWRRAFGVTWRFDSGDAGGCKSRGNPELHRRDRRKVRGSRRLGTPSVGADRRRFRATWRFTVGIAGGCRIRGNPETHRKATLEERRFGETWRFTSRYRRRVQDSRKLENPSPAQPEDAGAEGTRAPHRRAERDNAWSEQEASLKVDGKQAGATQGRGRSSLKRAECIKRFGQECARPD